MFHQAPTDNTSVLGEALHKAKRKSIFLESGLSTPQPPKAAPARLFNKPTEAFTKENGVIYDTLKPIYFLMRLMGIFPAANTDSGIFKVNPQWLGYSVLVFAVVIGFIGYIKWHSIEVVRSQEGRFEEAVIDYLFTVYLLPIIINPIVWYEGRKLADVVTNWIFFERSYSKVTKKKMSLFLGNKPLIITIVLPFISCGIMVVTHITMADIKIIQVRGREKRSF